MLHRTLALILLAAPALSACSSSEGGPGEGAPQLSQRPSISECGGFAAQPGARIEPPVPDPATYCEAERLLWAHDAATEELALTNSRIVLNCCGEHSISVAEDAGVYVVTERDAPVDGDARCGCECVFDFAVVVESIPAGVIGVRVVRDVTDSGEAPRVVYEGSIDLSQGEGVVTVDSASAEPWCSGATQ
ncbi:MAG: hypothetical protein IT372_18515 [Polyangiaceae bacterium]|nr:hypothetical protein [Polyangiaceae bacterium]